MRCLRLLLPLALMLAAVPALAARQGSYTMEVLVDGQSLAEYAARGTRYIEAIEGCEYSIRLRNHTSGRIAVALSVDGLNSIDAKTTTAHKASKWILGPYETVTLDGWQTGNSTARRFFFTTEDRSYGEWLGQTSNLGNITAAVFREKVRPRPQPILKSESGKRSRRDAPAKAGRAGAAESPSAARQSERFEAGDAAESQAQLSDDLAATGIGRELQHRVQRVKFEAERSPTSVIELRYEYHDALVSLGVLPPAFANDRLNRREHSRGFENLDFAPDPFRNPRP